jgi:nicotinate-nucleotide pyrophosphorylase (carboxylating)
VGGGVNHRIGLFDAVMLKENHVRAAGSLTAAIHAARAMHPSLPLIVEVESIAQLDEALRQGCDRILIDDFDAAIEAGGRAHRQGRPSTARFRWKYPAAST